MKRCETVPGARTVLPAGPEEAGLAVREAIAVDRCAHSRGEVFVPFARMADDNGARQALLALKERLEAFTQEG
jgi:hypothetical protein